MTVELVRYLRHGSTAVAKLLHDVWSAAPWVPTPSIGLGVYDGTLTGAYAGTAGVDFLFPLAMHTHITFWTDLTKLTPEQQAETAWWIRWYDAHRDQLSPAVYELSGADPLDGRSWAAWQPWDATGPLVIARGQQGPLAEPTRGDLDEAHVYHGVVADVTRIP